MAKPVYLFDDPSFRRHDTGAGHPERAARLEAIIAGLKALGLDSKVDWRKASPARPPDLLRVHTERHVKEILALAGKEESIDADTVVSAGSVDAARIAVGAALAAVDLVLADREAAAFCLGRPPGHHAERNRAMGFCLFNQVAAAAAYAREEKGVERVLIFDPDVHHGNGTQDIFYDRGDVCYVSIHQSPLFPGTGSMSETGSGPGAGLTMNLPLAAGMGDAEYCHLVDRVVLPLLKRFKPDLVLVSAGFDAHADDPLGGMNVTAAGFAAFYSLLMNELAALRAPAIFCLEGGYSLPALADAVPAVVEMLLHGSGHARSFGAARPAAERAASEALALLDL